VTDPSVRPRAAAVRSPAGQRPGAGAPDPASRAWLEELRSEGAARDAAVARLHALLLRAARFEIARRRPGLAHLRGDELGDIAMEAADDALVAVLAHLDDYRGLSRFTTWTAKFAVLEAAVRLRRRAWQAREIPLAPPGWELIADASAAPQRAAEQAQLLAALRDAIAGALTPHQREVLLAIVFEDVPIDVLAERLGTTRGALYKTLHDARRRLRARLAAQGLGPDAAPRRR
jgi:RNA polymerase sigma-70 factor, ECF subfamily